jgi:hypothetical protein
MHQHDGGGWFPRVGEVVAAVMKFGAVARVPEIARCHECKTADAAAALTPRALEFLEREL